MCETCDKIMENNSKKVHCVTKKRRLEEKKREKFEKDGIAIKTIFVYPKNGEEIIYGMDNFNTIRIYDTTNNVWEEVNKLQEHTRRGELVKVGLTGLSTPSPKNRAYSQDEQDAYWHGIAVMEEEYRKAINDACKIISEQWDEKIKRYGIRDTAELKVTRDWFIKKFKNLF